MAQRRLRSSSPVADELGDATKRFRDNSDTTMATKSMVLRYVGPGRDLCVEVAAPTAICDKFAQPNESASAYPITPSSFLPLFSEACKMAWRLSLCSPDKLSESQQLDLISACVIIGVWGVYLTDVVTDYDGGYTASVVVHARAFCKTALEKMVAMPLTSPERCQAAFFAKQVITAMSAEHQEYSCARYIGWSVRTIRISGDSRVLEKLPPGLPIVISIPRQNKVAVVGGSVAGALGFLDYSHWSGGSGFASLRDASYTPHRDWHTANGGWVPDGSSLSERTTNDVKFHLATAVFAILKAEASTEDALEWDQTIKARIGWLVMASFAKAPAPTDCHPLMSAIAVRHELSRLRFKNCDCLEQVRELLEGNMMTITLKHTD